MTAPDVAIIGGGIAGTSTAAYLARAGLSVVLHERTAIAAGASGRNSGVVQHPRDWVLAELYERTIRAYRELETLTDAGFRLGARPAGLLLLGRDEPVVRGAVEWWARAWPETEAELLGPPWLRSVEPELAPDLHACRLDIGYPVAPSAATEAFWQVASRHGATLRLGHDATPAIERGHVTGVLVDGVLEPAGRVVVAAGPWTPAVVDPTGSWRPIVPMWGVVASVELARAPRHALESIDIEGDPDDDDEGPAPVLAEDTLLVPPADDAGVDFSLVPADRTSSLGSTFLRDEPDAPTWVPALQRIGARYVPAIADAPVVGLRHCARPFVRDERPLIGPAGWVDGLWILAGHGLWGISTGPGSARMLVDAMLGGELDRLALSLNPNRFGAPGA